MPLADKYRPKKIEDIVGQRHVVGRGKLFNNMLEKNYYPNMIFFGAPGIGKTTIAEILAANADKSFFKINASNSSLEDVKKVIGEVGKLQNSKGDRKSTRLNSSHANISYAVFC